MTRTIGGDWTVTVYLPPGRVLYLFDVDGQFWLDPHDDARVPNSRGSEYSVRHITGLQTPPPPPRRDGTARPVHGER